MTKLRRERFLAPSSDTFVAHQLRTIGYATHTTGFYQHAFMQLLLRMGHGLLPDLMNMITLRMMRQIKNKALKLNQKFEDRQKNK